MQHKQLGFTLIELIVFIVVTSLLMSTFLLGGQVALRNAPVTHKQWIALQTARGCLEWFVDQFSLQGYTVLSCPSTPTPSACSAPSGYTVTTNISCTTWNSDTAYKTITVTVSGLASTSLSTQVGNSL
ncbi:MAG TPA: type II secretion system protein [Gammaproteobacteria bacterium]|jgi:type II secretory pathway pseudopilin PulG|nr:type II secretion system protein [Gammaproteobacteria bacterium]